MRPAAGRPCNVMSVCLCTNCIFAAHNEQAQRPADHPARSHFKNESDFVPQSGYFSVNVPGAHIISLHSYVSCLTCCETLAAAGIRAHGWGWAAGTLAGACSPGNCIDTFPVCDTQACPLHLAPLCSCPGASSRTSTAGWRRTWRQVCARLPAFDVDEITRSALAHPSRVPVC